MFAKPIAKTLLTTKQLLMLRGRAARVPSYNAVITIHVFGVAAGPLVARKAERLLGFPIYLLCTHSVEKTLG